VFTALDSVLFNVRIEDQDHSARLLRDGVVMGAVTTERNPVPGCRVQALRVRLRNHRRQAWNRDDTLQDMLVHKVFRRAIPRPTHFVPTAEGFGAAVLAGLGWGMYPDELAAADLPGGSFFRVSDAHLDVRLYWQCWKLDNPMVKDVTEAVRSAAAELRRNPK
jgi:LysR family transcriptional regulator, chromosome initiation inhibitor